MILVDSSVYIDILRADRNPAIELASEFEITEIAGCNVVRCEVLRGVIRPEARERLRQFFDLLIHVGTDHRVWQATEDLAWELDRAGKIIPLPDLIIAICALRLGATVLTMDRHFQKIPELRVASW